MNGTCHNIKEESAKVKDCGCAPFEFARPRFFYGQRLGALDFNDWVWYHAGKQRLHNLHAHGVGILCGLQAQRYDLPGQAATTVLKVTKGLALDFCGREVIVNVDQCIDMGAWFLQHRDDPEIQEWLLTEELRLCIGLRYAECPSDPSPAPRDPCGCGEGGCEYSRVREGFDLRVFTPAQMAALADSPDGGAPSTHVDDLLTALADSSNAGGGDALAAAMRCLGSRPCKIPDSDGWLWLACFGVQLSGSLDSVENLLDVDNTIRQRLVLLPVQTVQALTRALIAAATASGAVGPGPRLTGFRFDGTGADSGTITLPIIPETDGTGTPIPISGITFDPAMLQVQRFDTVAGWQGANPGAGDTVEYRTDPLPHIFIDWAGGLSEGMYRLSLIQTETTPVVDERMQPLRPLTFIQKFTLTDVGGTLAMESNF